MTFSYLNNSDIIEICPNIHNDERGHFFECFHKKSLCDFLNQEINFVQENQSFSTKNIFRGMHYQIPPVAQSKLIKVNSGSILDILIDIRKSSKNFLKVYNIILSEKNKKQLFIPRGYAHGFYVLSENAVVEYKIDNYYSKKHERIISIKDKAFSFLNLNKMILSYKDNSAPLLKNSDFFN